MAQQEADRDDLFAEATALTQRIELLLPEAADAVVAGRRTNGAWSIYFGPDPCYHFDPNGRLRRAYASGHLYRTQGTTLARLTRDRTRGEVVLHRFDLSDDDLGEFMRRVRAMVESLRETLIHGRMKILRQFPEGEDIVGLLETAIERILTEWPRLAPAIPTRRGR